MSSMPVEEILNEDWSEIDREKPRLERGTISCEQVKELEHLIDVFKKHYPGSTEREIIYAIAGCWKSVKGSQPRQQFIERVAAKL